MSHSSPTALGACAIVIWAHGSRDPVWRDNIEAMAQRLRQASPHTPVTCAYLELCEPDLIQAVRPMVEQGINHFRVLPLFFGIGKHIRADLPERIQGLIQAYPGLRVDLLPAAGDDPGVQDAVVQLALQSTA